MKIAELPSLRPDQLKLPVGNDHTVSLGAWAWSGLSREPAAANTPKTLAVITLHSEAAG